MNSTEGTDGAMIFEDLYVDITYASSPPPLLSYAVLGVDLRTAGTYMGSLELDGEGPYFSSSCNVHACC